MAHHDRAEGVQSRQAEVETRGFASQSIAGGESAQGRAGELYEISGDGGVKEL